MERRDIKVYILKHRQNYSQESITNQLVESGADRNEVNSIYDEINSNSSLNKVPNPNKKTKSGLGLALILIGFFIPVIGIILIIIGIVFGFKARKINPDEGLGLTNIILGFILLFLHIFIVIPIFGVFVFQMWFTTYQSGINAKVMQESQTSSIFSVERVEADGTVYVKNNGVEPMDVVVKIPGGSGCGELELLVNGTSVVGGDVPGCNLTPSEKIDVVVVAPSGVFQSTQIVKE